MKLKFSKIQAQGNDYIYFDFLEKALPPLDLAELSRKLSNRHFGIGADGIVLILPDSRCDAAMRIYNADGSEAEMCGSALRSIGFYLYKKSKKKNLIVSSLSGIHPITITETNDIIVIKTQIGTPKFIETKAIEIFGYSGYKIDVGNPHFVIFGKKLTETDLRTYGPKIENNVTFPRKTNVEFVEIINAKTLSIQFWERGSGITLACGTGTIASFFAASELGFVQNKIDVTVPGGRLHALCEDRSYFLIGTVQYVFSGEVEI